jgi:hypothetical protein
MLYITPPSPIRSKLQTLASGANSRRIIKPFLDIDQPLRVMLNRYKVIPIRSRDDMNRDGWEITEPSESILVSFVCFQSLQNVASIEIEWVDELSLHLEFNRVARRLKIFRFPSFCRLMYSSSDRSIVSRYVIMQKCGNPKDNAKGISQTHRWKTTIPS